MRSRNRQQSFFGESFKSNTMTGIIIYTHLQLHTKTCFTTAMRSNYYYQLNVELGRMKLFQKYLIKHYILYEHF